MPAPQSPVHAAGAPKALEYEPAAHAWHTATADVAAEAVEYVPAPQSPVHAAGAPSADEYEPAAQL